MEAFSAQTNDAGETFAPAAPGGGHHHRAAAFRLSRSERAGHATVRHRSGFRSTGRRTRLRLKRAEAARSTARSGSAPRAICNASPRAAASRRPTISASSKRSRPMPGLGSGTQLALAVGSAFAALEGLNLAPQDIAARLGRGRAFGHRHRHLRARRRGAGRRVHARTHCRQLISRLPFPPDMARAADLRRRDHAGLPERARRRRSRRCPIFRRARPRSFTGASQHSALPALVAERLQDLLRAGWLFAGLHGRLFRAAARRRLCQPRRRRRAGLAARAKGSPGSAKARGDRPASPLSLPRHEGQALLDRLRARCPRSWTIASRWRKAATTAANIETAVARNAVSDRH